MPAVGCALFSVGADVAACVDRSSRCRLDVLHRQAVNRHSVHPTLLCGLISLASIKRTSLCATARLLHADAGPQRLLLLENCPCEGCSADLDTPIAHGRSSQPGPRSPVSHVWRTRLQSGTQATKLRTTRSRTISLSSQSAESSLHLAGSTALIVHISLERRVDHIYISIMHCLPDNQRVGC